MLNRKITACFTGHREISDGQEEKISAVLDNIIEMLYRNGVIYYGAGGACGFDMLAEKAVLRARERHSEIKLILVLPCKDHDKYWSIENKNEFDRILKKADKVVYIGEYYRQGCMFERNRRLVNFSGFCIAYLIKKQGGTAYTVDYASQNGLYIINTALSS